MPTPGNALNITQAGVVSFDGVSVFTGSPLTQFDVLVGGANNTITSITPGAIGTVLTSNGTSANPSFQNSMQPNSIVYDFDDFISCGESQVTEGVGFSKWNWYVYNDDSFYPLVGTAKNPGQFVVTNPSATQSVGIATTDGATATIFPFVMGGGAFNLNWVVNLGTLSNGTNRYVVYVGLGFANGSPITEPANGIYFTYSDNVNSGNWVAKTASAGTRTTVNSSVAGSTSFFNLGIQVNASATSVTFTINGTAFGSSTTNIPTVAIPIAFSGVATSGTYPLGTQALDIVYYTQILTTAR